MTRRRGWIDREGISPLVRGRSWLVKCVIICGPAVRSSKIQFLDILNHRNAHLPFKMVIIWIWKIIYIRAIKREGNLTSLEVENILKLSTPIFTIAKPLEMDGNAIWPIAVRELPLIQLICAEVPAAADNILTHSFSPRVVNLNVCNFSHLTLLTRVSISALFVAHVRIAASGHCTD